MFNKELRKCESILEKHGLPVPDITIETTNNLLSYTYSDGIIYIGLLARAAGLLSKKTLRHTILHEMMHNVFDSHTPNWEIRTIFGTEEEWAEEQKMLRYLSLKSGYVSNYAKTHPEEDFVETAVALLEDRKEFGPKVGAVRRWFKRTWRGSN